VANLDSVARVPFVGGGFDIDTPIDTIRLSEWDASGSE